MLENVCSSACALVLCVCVCVCVCDGDICVTSECASSYDCMTGVSGGDCDFMFLLLLQQHLIKFLVQ